MKQPGEQSISQLVMMDDKRHKTRPRGREGEESVSEGIKKGRGRVSVAGRGEGGGAGEAGGGTPWWRGDIYR